ncbi:hypothetical protein OG625_26855 [Streptomyces sp. NBC_01351]|uniref:hypothetical protein n=1 Tax=Streptomyces sp. NBC_01351 TaxID=2903833 RepID=UPI002E30CFC9|nr:hypothetical protein [Streptomyces sp. NBC_01351]
MATAVVAAALAPEDITTIAVPRSASARNRSTEAQQAARLLCTRGLRPSSWLFAPTRRQVTASGAAPAPSWPELPPEV